MAISDAARRNHQELFPDHVSTLARTDPELIEVFDNFAFDQVMTCGGLETPTRLMVQLASLIACQALSEYWVMLGAALTAGVTPVQAKEVLYQRRRRTRAAAPGARLPGTRQHHRDAASTHRRFRGPT